MFNYEAKLNELNQLKDGEELFLDLDKILSEAELSPSEDFWALAEATWLFLASHGKVEGSHVGCLARLFSMKMQFLVVIAGLRLAQRFDGMKQENVTVN